MFAPEPWAIGIGISPPARKLASLPLSATRFGSARVWNRPRVWRSRTAAPRSYFWLKRKKFRKSPKLIFPEALVTLEPKSLLNLLHDRSEYSGALNCCVVMRPMLLLIPVGL